MLLGQSPAGTNAATENAAAKVETRLLMLGISDSTMNRFMNAALVGVTFRR